MDNQQIATTLDQLADLLEFQGANPFRLNAYRNGARAIRELTQSVASLVAAGQDLSAFDSIGKSVAQKCTELCQTGQLQQLEDILTEVPRSVLDLLNIPKLGPKKAALLFNKLGIKNLDELKIACEAGKVRELPGFAAKSEQSILDGIKIAAAANQRILWAEADRLAQRIREHMEKSPAATQLEFAGSYRRGCDTVGDLDLLVAAADATIVMDHFATFSEIGSVTARGDTKLSVRTSNAFQIDLRVVPADSFGAALQYFTGSKEHNVVLRGKAKQAGLRINEWGVYRMTGDESTWIAGRTEAEVYDTLGLPLFEPEIRENRQEFEWAEQGKLPLLIQLADIQGDLHMHTSATDGSATIREMAVAAKLCGLKYIAITDHSKRVAMANGLNAERLLAQWVEIDRINNEATDDFLILKGIECDILESGGMDLPDAVLARADWVIGSLHYGQSQPRTQITDRIVGAIENEFVSMIAHPTGRILNKRPAYDVDLEGIFQAALENGKFLELNASPKRLDLNDINLIAANSRGIPIVINTDAHHPAGLGNMQYGIKQARRGCLTSADVANTRSWEEVKKQLNSGKR